MLLLTFVVWCLSSTTVHGFPSLLTANASLAIIIDKEFIGDGFEDIEKTIKTYMEFSKREILRHGGVNTFYYYWSTINVKNDFTAILSIASCSDTWKLHKAAQSEDLLLMAISEADCPRLPTDQAITIPIINRGDETPQLLLDLRTGKIYNWKSAVLLYDHTMTDDIMTRIIKSLTKRTYYNDVQALGVSLIKLETNETTTLLEIFSTIRPKVVGGNFLVIVSYEQVAEIMTIAKALDLVNTKNQWLYIITDTNYAFLKTKSYKKLLREGDNVAFIYNSTIVDDICRGGRLCHIQEVLEGFTRALEDAIVDEQEIAEQVSDEEWEAIRPTKFERRNYLLSKIKKHLVDRGTCDNCTFWKMKTGETWGREYQFQIKKQSEQPLQRELVAEILSVGTWRPSDGATMTDELFPHITHGFRGKTLPMVSFHNPPWQIIKTNTSGNVVEFSGLVFDIIKELSRNLNFTYTVEISKSNINGTSFQPKNESKYGIGLLEMADVTTFRMPKDILEMVHNKTVAMGACGFTITENNKKLINFTIPISIQPYTFLVARPRELSRALLFISPFSGDVSIAPSKLNFYDTDILI